MLKKLFTPKSTSDAGAPANGLLLDYPALMARVVEQSPQYASNTPFPHIVIDDFLPASTMSRLLEEYPRDQADPMWNDATHADKASGEYVQKDKRNIRNPLRMPPAYRQLFWELNSHGFLEYLSHLSGIANLIPDPNLRGAGIHQIARGGFLKVHTDFTTHRDFGLDRRLNVLIYLNEEWPESYGGHLELWDPAMSEPPKRVLPILNRCVVFSTTSTSFHGHPLPLTCPDGVYRRSLALYYYTNGRPAGEAEPGFATHWRDLPA
jgi:Rps23 Pro-64 3,4-dihydroxylase Tpa1-like proline 4-hydroxylase